MIEAETCCHLVTLNKINIHNTSCVLTCKSLLLICVYRWGAGLVVTGRISDIGQKVLQSYFQTGSGNRHSYFLNFLIAFHEVAFISNIIIILCIDD